MTLKSNKYGNALPPKKNNNLTMKSTATDSEELSSSDAEILAQIAAIKAENEALKRDLQAKVSTVKKTKSLRNTLNTNKTSGGNNGKSRATAATEKESKTTTSEKGGKLNQRSPGSCRMYVGVIRVYGGEQRRMKPWQQQQLLLRRRRRRLKSTPAPPTSSSSTSSGSSTSLLTPGFEIDPIVKSESPKNIVFVTSEVAAVVENGRFSGRLRVVAASAGGERPPRDGYRSEIFERNEKR